MRILHKTGRAAAAVLLVLVASIALAAGFDRLQDTVKIGQGNATDKTIEFDIGLGGSNPKVVANGSTGLITFSGNGGLSPVGAVIPFAGDTAPAGFLLCDGSEVSRSTYAALFAVIGTTYGAGNGTTTFNLPDLRGRVVAGRDLGPVLANRLTSGGSGITGTTLGAAGGAQTHSLSTAELASHNHGVGTLATSSAGNHSHGPGGGEFIVGLSILSGQSGSGVGGISSGATASTTTTDGAHTHSMTGNTANNGSGTAHQNTQPTIVLNYLIKT